MKAYAASISGTAVDPDTILKGIIDNIINPAIYLLMAVAVMYFLWGAFQFVRNADSSDERKKGGLNMMWGVIGLFIMVSAYGILNLIVTTVR